jgi:carnosine N-methyltransferase
MSSFHEGSNKKNNNNPSNDDKLPVNEENTSSFDYENDEEEKEHWWFIMRTLLSYEDFYHCELKRLDKHLSILPKEYAKRLPSITHDKLGLLQEAANLNQIFFEDMVHFHASNGFSLPPRSILELVQANKQVDEGDKEILPDKEIGRDPVDIRQQHRNQAVLHSVYREWSVEGAEERAQSFGVLCDELARVLPLTNSSEEKRVLVPGCGLGRLPIDIASKGYYCEGNEFSA